MTFLAPWMLWGMLAASVPVIVHLFFRARYRPLPWAAMKFLLASVEQTSRRVKFQELILLLVRTLILLLLALALARCSSVGDSGAGQSVDAVLVVDVSYSMGAREDGKNTRLDLALEAARDIVRGLPVNSTVQVVTTATRAELAGPVAASKLDRAIELLDGEKGRVKLSHQASDLLPGVTKAVELLNRGQLPNKELYILSDMQKLAWDAQATALNSKIEEIGQRASVTIVRCGTRTPINASLVGISPQAGIPHTDERVGFAVLARNRGNESVQDLTVTLVIGEKEEDKESQPLPPLAPGQTHAVTLTGKLEKAGLRVVTAELGPDELESDNRFQRVIRVREQARALVVDGAPNETHPEEGATFYLLHSLRPVPEAAWAGYHIQPRTVVPANAASALLADMDLCILVNVSVQQRGGNNPEALPSEFVDGLERFVREGKGLLVFGGPKVNAKEYNEILFEKHGLLPYPLGEIQEAPEGGAFNPDPSGIGPNSFLATFREQPLSGISLSRISRYHDLKTDDVPGSRVLLRYGDGRPMAALRKVGAGEAIFVTTTADRSWTNLPLLPPYLPFVHVTLARLLEGPTAALNRTAGEPLRWAVPSALSNRVFTATDPDGQSFRLGSPKLVDSIPIVEHSRTFRAGLYRISAEKKEKDGPLPDEIFAVTPDVREAEDLGALTDEQIQRRQDVTVNLVDASANPAAAAAAARLKKEWALWILFFVFLLVLFETWFAWYCGRGW